MEAVKRYTDAGRRDEIWIHVFLNKSGLRALFRRLGRPLAANSLDNFIIGMNEAAKTIMVVDVGQKKEAADSKIKGGCNRGFFDSYSCAYPPQFFWRVKSVCWRHAWSLLQVRTSFVCPTNMPLIYGLGSHDNGYVTELRAHVTAGYKEKLVLVPSYTEVASGYKELNLATLHIPNLFMPEKLPRYI